MYFNPCVILLLQKFRLLNLTDNIKNGFVSKLSKNYLTVEMSVINKY